MMTLLFLFRVIWIFVNIEKINRKAKENWKWCWICCGALRTRPSEYANVNGKWFWNQIRITNYDASHEIGHSYWRITILRYPKTARPIDSSPAWCYGVRATCCYTGRTHTYVLRAVSSEQHGGVSFTWPKTIANTSLTHTRPHSPQQTILFIVRRVHKCSCHRESCVHLPCRSNNFFFFFLNCALFIAIHCARIL